MKIAEARRIMEEGIDQGFMVHFEWVKGSMLHSDYFPDKHAGESLFSSEDEAWEQAGCFAKTTCGRCVNIYVIKQNFTPVRDYKTRMIPNRLFP